MAAVALGGPAPKQSAQPDQQKPQAEQAKPASAIAANPKPVEPVQPSEYYRPCGDARQDGNSDLCAQWTAAKGAADAAYWAKWSFWIGFIGFGGLLGTLYYTRKAVLAAEEGMKDADDALAIARENAKAAADQVVVSEQTAHRQLRPYVYLTRCDVSYGHMGGFDYISDKGDITLHFKNFGHTPAKHVKLRAKTLIGGVWNEPFDVNFDDCTLVHLGDMPPGFEKDRDGYSVLGVRAAYHDIIAGVASVFVCGTIEYSDGTPGQAPYKSEFRLAATEDEFSRERFSPTPRGNESD